MLAAQKHVQSQEPLVSKLVMGRLGRACFSSGKRSPSRKRWILGAAHCFAAYCIYKGTWFSGSTSLESARHQRGSRGPEAFRLPDRSFSTGIFSSRCAYAYVKASPLDFGALVPADSIIGVERYPRSEGGDSL